MRGHPQVQGLRDCTLPFETELNDVIVDPLHELRVLEHPSDLLVELLLLPDGLRDLHDQAANNPLSMLVDGEQPPR